jgi:hypothetical protein
VRSAAAGLCFVRVPAAGRGHADCPGSAAVGRPPSLRGGQLFVVCRRSGGGPTDRLCWRRSPALAGSALGWPRSGPRRFAPDEVVDGSVHRGSRDPHNGGRPRPPGRRRGLGLPVRAATFSGPGWRPSRATAPDGLPPRHFSWARRCTRGSRWSAFCPIRTRSIRAPPTSTDLRAQPGEAQLPRIRAHAARAGPDAVTRHARCIARQVEGYEYTCPRITASGLEPRRSRTGQHRKMEAC